MSHWVSWCINDANKSCYFSCNIAILIINDAGYCCIISRISKREGIDLFQKADLYKKVHHYRI